MKNKSSKRMQLMKFLNGVMYICMILLIINLYISKIWNSTTYDMFSKIIFAIIAIVCVMWLFMCQQETLNDKDETAKEMFSLNISFVALVISLVALFKGVS